MEITTRYNSLTYTAHVTVTIGNSVIEATIKPNSLVDISVESQHSDAITLTTEEWHAFAAAVNAAIDLVEHHAGRHQLAPRSYP